MRISKRSAISVSYTHLDVYKRQENTMELLWCLYQNEYFDEAISLCREFTPDDNHRYSYENLFGRLLFSAGEYDQALPHLKYWLELIEASPDDGSEENTRRKSREPWACDIISRCLYEKKDYDQALAYSCLLYTSRCV